MTYLFYGGTLHERSEHTPTEKYVKTNSGILPPGDFLRQPRCGRGAILKNPLPGHDILVPEVQISITLTFQFVELSCKC
jgi:hypothetical protein